MATTESTSSDNVVVTESSSSFSSSSASQGDNNNTTTTGSTTSEELITINDPVKVTIEVVHGTGGSSAQGETSSSSSTSTDNASDLTQLVKTEATSSSQQSVTLNEPKKVTIRVVKGNGDITTSSALLLKKQP